MVKVYFAFSLQMDFFPCKREKENFQKQMSQKTGQGGRPIRSVCQIQVYTHSKTQIHILLEACLCMVLWPLLSINNRLQWTHYAHILLYCDLTLSKWVSEIFKGYTLGAKGVGTQ